jgi:iron complex transport system ATP-binding protein
MDPTSSALEADLCQVAIGTRTILQPVSLRIPAGRWSAVVGPNGAGKSTLLRVLGGLLACSGEVRLLGRALGHWRPRERARHLAWLGQAEASPSELLAWDVVMLGRLPHRDWLAAPSSADRAVVERCLRTMESWKLRDRRLGELSGGERQRVLLARLLAVEADVLLMDEPLAHLDPPHQSLWLTTVRKLVAGGTTVVSVLHELNMALQAEDLIVVQNGTVVHQGPCADSAAHLAVEAVFDHRVRVHPVGDRWIALPRDGDP